MFEQSQHVGRYAFSCVLCVHIHLVHRKEKTAFQFESRHGDGKGKVFLYPKGIACKRGGVIRREFELDFFAYLYGKTMDRERYFYSFHRKNAFVRQQTIL